MVLKVTQSPSEDQKTGYFTEFRQPLNNKQLICFYVDC